jgi:nickel-dependent lactate racemase
MMLLNYPAEEPITTDKTRELVTEALAGVNVKGKRVLVIIPDNTRTLPMPAFFETISQSLSPRAGEVTFLVALGTHPPLTEEELTVHLGPRWTDFPNVRIMQHEWDNPAQLTEIGPLPREEMEEISGGLLSQDISVQINRSVFTHDLVIILGPVFPHEVVGFSAGHKYFFPGISGPDMVHYSHWLGALITNPKTIGHEETPVRRMIERAAALVSTPQIGISLVMQAHNLMGIFVGDVGEAWREAVRLSAEVNIVWVEHPFHTVLSVAPAMYRELWTGGKCMYKMEPVIADGGKVIIYAPGIDEISTTHGELIRRIGYHTRDYFLAQWDQFKKFPKAILAHSTHVKGIGSFVDGIEQARIEVILATGIPDSLCQQINLGYINPAEIAPKEYADREKEGILFVPEAGEQLYRLADGTVPDIDRL